MTRPISLAALTVLELTPTERVRCAAEAGFSHVSLRLLPATPQEPAYDLVGDTPQVRALAREISASGLQVLDVEIFRLQAATVVGDFEAAVATAARLGARQLLVAGNDPDEARLTARFAAFCELAARHGLGASLEFMPWTDVKDLTQAARVVQAAGCTNGGVLIDAFHLSRSGSRIDDIARIPPARLPYMQLCDVPAALPPDMDALLTEARSERRFPGEGELDLVGLLRALPAELPLSVEVPTHTLARSLGALARARRALAGTRAVLARVKALHAA